MRPPRLAMRPPRQPQQQPRLPAPARPPPRPRPKLASLPRRPVLLRPKPQTPQHPRAPPPLPQPRHLQPKLQIPLHSPATSAANSATTATTQAGIASAAATAATLAANALANQWLFSNSTTMADPSTGNIRFNNATIGSVTQLAISGNSADSGNPSLHDYVASWGNSSHNPRGIIKMEKNSTNFVIFGVNGAVTDNTTWLQVPVSVVASVGSFSNTDDTFIALYTLW